MPRKKTTLPQPGDPLVTIDGETINPDEEDIDTKALAPLQKALEPSDFRPERRISLKELPAEPKQFNVIALVFVYTISGVSDQEIATTFNITPADVRRVRKSPAYKETFELFLSEFINSNSNLLQSRIASYSHNALTNVADLAMNSKKDIIRLQANKDILDRAGVRPKDMEGKGVSSQNELRIVITKPEEQVSVDVEVDGDLIDDETGVD